MGMVIRHIVIITFALFFSIDALAEESIKSDGVLDAVLSRYNEVASTWGTVITNYATRLFWSLAAISMTWTFGMMILRQADIAEVFAELARFMIFIGFYLWLLRNGSEFAATIYKSLMQIGGEASGLGQLSPSGVVDVGFSIFYKVLSNVSYFSPFNSLGALIIGLMILVILALIAINMLLLMISSWLLAYAGIFFLGFGGSRWTSDIAINYFKTVLGIAVQLMVMVLLVGIGQIVLTEYLEKLGLIPEFGELGIMLVISITLYSLTTKLPQMVAGVLSGASTGGVGIGNVTGGALVGAAAAVASGGVSAAAGVAGGSQALSAAFKAATAMDSGGSGSSGIGSAIARAASVTASTGSILGKAAMNEAGSRIGARVANTTGGRMASAIKAQSQTSSKKEETDSKSEFSGNSLGGAASGEQEQSKDQDQNQTEVDHDAEIAAFVNKK